LGFETKYPIEVVWKMGSLGFFGALFPKEYDGTNMRYLAQTLLLPGRNQNDLDDKDTRN
jgi:alkylation response protein AidB-like acyl-CoA dehydrogenase